MRFLRLPGPQKYATEQIYDHRGGNRGYRELGGWAWLARSTDDESVRPTRLCTSGLPLAFGVQRPGSK
jgi:hypothetical protein